MRSGAYSRAMKARMVPPSKRFDGLGPAEDRTPDRLAGEGRLHEGVEDEIVGVVLDGRVFLQDDALLARELALLEARTR